MKTLFIILFLVFTASAFAQANFRTEFLNLETNPMRQSDSTINIYNIHDAGVHLYKAGNRLMSGFMLTGFTAILGSFVTAAVPRYAPIGLGIAVTGFAVGTALTFSGYNRLSRAGTSLSGN